MRGGRPWTAGGDQVARDTTRRLRRPHNTRVSLNTMASPKDTRAFSPDRHSRSCSVGVCVWCARIHNTRWYSCCLSSLLVRAVAHHAPCWRAVVLASSRASPPAASSPLTFAEVVSDLEPAVSAPSLVACTHVFRSERFVRIGHVIISYKL